MKVTFPFWGNYTLAFEKLAEMMGLEVVTPSKISSKTVESGAKLAPEMYCFPLKTNLGNFLEAVEKGADTIVMPTAMSGSCRLRYYPFVQEKVLKEQGFDVNFIVFDQSLKSIYQTVKKITRFSFFKILLGAVYFYKLLRTIEEIEEKSWFLRPREKEKGATDKFLKEAFSRLKKTRGILDLVKVKKEIFSGMKKINIEKKDVPKVGIVGEIYTVCDYSVNFEVERKLGQLGIEVAREINLSYHLKKRVFPWIERKIAKKTKKYLKSGVGGHGRDAVYETLVYAEKNFDGIVQVMPFACFLKDTNITVEGYLQKPIQDVKVGEKVLTHKGRFKKVTHKFCRPYQGPILKIDCGGKLLTLQVTPEHPILLAKVSIKNQKKEIKDFGFFPVHEAKEGDFVAIPIPKEVKNKKHLLWNKKYNRPSKWEDIKKFPYSPEICRMLGYWLAEGNIHYDYEKTNKENKKKYKRGLFFTFSSKESRYVDDIQNIIKTNFNSYIKTYFTPRKPTAQTLYVGNRSLADIIHFLCGSGCDRKTLHPALLSLPPQLQKEIVKGFFRGDGCLRDEYGETSWRAVTTSWNLTSQMFWLLIRNRIKPSILEQRIEGKKPFWTIKIPYAEGIKKLGDETVTVAERKKVVRFRELEDYFLIPIKKIEKFWFEGEVYNLEVEEDHSYVANFVAAHNCMPESSVRPILEKIHEETGIPFLSLSIDEQTGQAGIETRLEAFADLVHSYFKNKKKTKVS